MDYSGNWGIYIQNNNNLPAILPWGLYFKLGGGGGEIKSATSPLNNDLLTL